MGCSNVSLCIHMHGVWCRAGCLRQRFACRGWWCQSLSPGDGATGVRGHWRSECVWLQHMLCKSMLAKCVLSNSHGAVLAFGVVSCSQHRHWCCRLAAVRFVCSVPGCLVIHPTCWRSLIADCDSLHSCQQSGRHMDMMASGLAGWLAPGHQRFCYCL